MLLLPTGHYLLGGALAVAASFVVLFLVPAGPLERLARKRLTLGSPPGGLRLAANWLSTLFLAVLIAAGAWGSPDPLVNPLPLTVWGMFWIGVTIAQGTLGDLWAWINPWAGPCRLAHCLGARPLARAPAGLGAAPALPLFLAFALFELVDPAPDDPRRLAAAAGAYWLFTLAAMLLFGFGRWSRMGEFFSILFRMLARLSVTGSAPVRGGRRIELRLPGAGLAQAFPLPLAATLLLIAALAAVSFDGLSKTFAFLGWFGVNPLEHPGRTALTGVHAFGLVMTVAAMAAAFGGGIGLGRMLSGGGVAFQTAAGLMVWSLAPIALAYHFAHYAAAFLVDAQYWLVALSDPFGRGWNLFGAAGMPVRAAITAGSRAAWWVWNAQAAAIIGGHLLAVLAAHGLAARLFPDPRRMSLFLLPLTVLMVLYTLLGLWLLSTPSAG